MIISVDNMCDHPALSPINAPASMDANSYLYFGLTSLEPNVCACLLRTFGPEKGNNPYLTNAAVTSRLGIKTAGFAVQILFKPYRSNVCS